MKTIIVHLDISGKASYSGVCGHMRLLRILGLRLTLKLPTCPRPAPRGWFDADVVDQSTILVSGGPGEESNCLGDAWLLQI